MIQSNDIYSELMKLVTPDSNNNFSEDYTVVICWLYEPCIIAFILNIEPSIRNDSYSIMKDLSWLSMPILEI